MAHVENARQKLWGEVICQSLVRVKGLIGLLFISFLLLLFSNALMSIL